MARLHIWACDREGCSNTSKKGTDTRLPEGWVRVRVERPLGEGRSGSLDGVACSEECSAILFGQLLMSKDPPVEVPSKDKAEETGPDHVRQMIQKAAEIAKMARVPLIAAPQYVPPPPLLPSVNRQDWPNSMPPVGISDQRRVRRAYMDLAPREGDGVDRLRRGIVEQMRELRADQQIFFNDQQMKVAAWIALDSVSGGLRSAADNVFDEDMVKYTRE